jgi:hypothetical protein
MRTEPTVTGLVHSTRTYVRYKQEIVPDPDLVPYPGSIDLSASD